MNICRITCNVEGRMCHHIISYLQNAIAIHLRELYISRMYFHAFFGYITNANVRNRLAKENVKPRP